MLSGRLQCPVIHPLGLEADKRTAEEATTTQRRGSVYTMAPHMAAHVATSNCVTIVAMRRGLETQEAAWEVATALTKGYETEGFMTFFALLSLHLVRVRSFLPNQST